MERSLGSHLELDGRISALLRELATKDAEARDLRMDLQYLEGADALSFPSEHPGGVRHPIPVEEQSSLLAARNTLRRAYDERVVAQAKQKQTAERLAVTAEETARLRSELELFQDAACWKPGDVYGYVDPVKMDNEVELYRHAIGELIDAREAEQRDIHIQTAEMTRLLLELQKADSAEEQLFNAQTDLRAIQEQIRLAQDEMTTLRRIYVRKDRMVNDMIQRDDAPDLRAIEAGKKLSATKLAKHRDIIRQNDVMIRNQGLRIQKLEDKMELIGEAIRGDDDTEVARVDAELLLEIQKEIAQLKAMSARQTQDMATLDAKLEAAEGCTQTLSHQKAVTQRKVGQAQASFSGNVTLLRTQSKTASANANRMMTETKTKIESCEKKLSLQEKQDERRRKAAEEEARQKVQRQREDEERRERIRRSKHVTIRTASTRSASAQPKSGATKKKSSDAAQSNSTTNGLAEGGKKTESQPAKDEKPQDEPKGKQEAGADAAAANEEPAANPEKEQGSHQSTDGQQQAADEPSKQADQTAAAPEAERHGEQHTSNSNRSSRRGSRAAETEKESLNETGNAAPPAAEGTTNGNETTRSGNPDAAESTVTSGPTGADQTQAPTSHQSEDGGPAHEPAEPTNHPPPSNHEPSGPS